MFLTDEQKAILDGEKGEVFSKVMQSVIRYGELFGADKLIPVTSKYNLAVVGIAVQIININGHRRTNGRNITKGIISVAQEH